MSKLPVISGAECVKALERIGFIMERQRGSHIILVRDEPRTTVSVQKLCSHFSHTLDGAELSKFVSSSSSPSLTD